MNDNEAGNVGMASIDGDAVQVRVTQRTSAKQWVEVTYQLPVGDHDTPDQDAARLARLRRMATAALDDIEALIAERGPRRDKPAQQQSAHLLLPSGSASLFPSLADLLEARASGDLPEIQGLEALDAAIVTPSCGEEVMLEAPDIAAEDVPTLLDTGYYGELEPFWDEPLLAIEAPEIADLDADPPAPVAPPAFPPNPELLWSVSQAVSWFCYRDRDQEEVHCAEGMISSWHRGVRSSALFSCGARYGSANAAYAEVLAYWLEGFPGDSDAVLQCLLADVVPFHLVDELRRFFAWIDHDPAKAGAHSRYGGWQIRARLVRMRAPVQVIRATYQAALEEHDELWLQADCTDEKRQALRARAAKAWPPRKPRRVRRRK